MKTHGGWLTARGLLLFGAVLVLSALVLFGLSSLKEKSETARREAAIEVAQQQLEEAANKEVAITEEAAYDEAPAEESLPGVEELPQTGVDGLGSIVALASVTFAITSYLGSRRALSRTFLS